MNFREAAMIPTVGAAILQLISVFLFPLTNEQLSLVNGALALIAGAITAFAVSAEKGLAALVGVGNAVVQVAIGFGLDLTTGQVAAIATALTVIAGLVTRTQVTAPVAPTMAKPVVAIPNQSGGMAG